MESEQKPFDDEFIRERKKIEVQAGVVLLAQEGKIDSQNTRIMAQIAEAQYEALFPYVDRLNAIDEALKASRRAQDSSSRIYRLIPRRFKDAENRERQQIAEVRKIGPKLKIKEILLGNALEYFHEHPEENKMEFINTVREQLHPRVGSKEPGE